MIFRTRACSKCNNLDEFRRLMGILAAEFLGSGCPRQNVLGPQPYPKCDRESRERTGRRLDRLLGCIVDRVALSGSRAPGPLADLRGCAWFPTVVADVLCEHNDRSDDALVVNHQVVVVCAVGHLGPVANDKPGECVLIRGLLEPAGNDRLLDDLPCRVDPTPLRVAEIVRLFVVPPNLPLERVAVGAALDDAHDIEIEIGELIVRIRGGDTLNGAARAALLARISVADLNRRTMYFLRSSSRCPTNRVPSRR
jgi:hypothetical protein